MPIKIKTDIDILLDKVWYMNLVGMRAKKEGWAIIKINQVCAASKDGTEGGVGDDPEVGRV